MHKESPHTPKNHLYTTQLGQTSISEVFASRTEVLKAFCQGWGRMRSMFCEVSQIQGARICGRSPVSFQINMLNSVDILSKPKAPNSKPWIFDR